MPKPYTVSRSITIDADPALVHHRIDDFHEWTAWSPWEAIDPGMRRTYSGPDSGVGAHYAWSGDKKAGAGTMEITASTPERIDVALHFDKPFTSDTRVEFGIWPDGAGTRVTWTMHGELAGVMRVVALVRPMDSLLGPDFERGLRQLKVVVETSPTP